MRRQTHFKNVLEKIGYQLATLRKEKGFDSIKDFAIAFGLPEIHYWRIEKGKTNITMKSLSKILDIHGVSLENFFCTIDVNEGVSV